MSGSVSFVVAAKAFGRISRRALEAPVVITLHGHDSLVLMSHAEYRRLREGQAAALAPFGEGDLVDAAGRAPLARSRGSDQPIWC